MQTNLSVLKEVALIKKIKHQQQWVAEFVYFLTTKYPNHHSHLGTESHKSPSKPFSSFFSQISKGTKGSAPLQIFFKIFPVFDFSDSSFGFRRNSGISKQISVPRWSSNLKKECWQNPPSRLAKSIFLIYQPSPSHDLQTFIQRNLRLL